MTSLAEREAIPESPPPDAKLGTTPTHIEGIGEPTNPLFFVNGQINPTNWYPFLPSDLPSHI